jgi:hypothetical protein
MVTWVGGEPIRLFLAREPDVGIDAVAAQTCRSARMALSLQQFTAVLAEFRDDALLIEMTDRGLIIRQGEKFGLLMSCRFIEKEIAA